MFHPQREPRSRPFTPARMLLMTDPTPLSNSCAACASPTRHRTSLDRCCQTIIHWAVKWRVNITSTVFVLLAVENILRGLKPHDLANLRDVHTVLGLTLVALGLGLRSWAAGTVHKSSALATSGPYALI